jgi:IclR family transcriptional regulator, KDG regulon repressor
MTDGAVVGDETYAPDEKVELQSLGRAIRILELIAAAPSGIGLSQLSRSSGMSKAIVLRILGTWQSNGYVTRRDDDCYRLDWKLYVMARGHSEAKDLRDTARPFLEKLSLVSGETSHLALMAQEEVVYIDKIEGRERVRVTSQVGRRVPLYATASGKAILAYQDDALVKKIMGSARPFTDRTVITTALILEDIAETRKRGFSIAKGELTEDVGSVGAPVFSSDGTVEAAVSIVFPLAGTSDERIAGLGALVSETTKFISEELGWIGFEKEDKWLTNQ